MGMTDLDQLKVEARGSTMIFSVNGQVVTQVNAADYAQGNVGFYVETLDETLAHIHYDALTIGEVHTQTEPQVAQVRDEFVDPDSGWPTLDLDNGRYGYHPPDYYHVEVSAPEDVLTVFQGPGFEDFTVETDVLVDHTDTESGDFRYGLAIRQTEAGYYVFTISPRSGSWQALKQGVEGLETLDQGAIDTLLGMTDLDQLKVEASGSTMIFSVNGQVVTQVSDADYAQGNVGFYVETLDETLAHIHYDALTIREHVKTESTTTSSWEASYFANDALSGEPAFSRQDTEIDFDWQMGSPHPALPDDHFSVRWQSTVDFQPGRYRFTTTTDDGVRLLVDGQLIIESWLPMQGVRTGLISLEGGPHALVLEYFEQEGAALARLEWTLVGPTDTP
jgi:mannan endo-1,4-beta-mannosidase